MSSRFVFVISICCNHGDSLTILHPIDKRTNNLTTFILTLVVLDNVPVYIAYYWYLYGQRYKETLNYELWPTIYIVYYSIICEGYRCSSKQFIIILILHRYIDQLQSFLVPYLLEKCILLHLYNLRISCSEKV